MSRREFREVVLNADQSAALQQLDAMEARLLADDQPTHGRGGVVVGIFLALRSLVRRGGEFVPVVLAQAAAWVVALTEDP